MPKTELDSSAQRVSEMVSVLRKREIVRGLTPEKLRLILEDLGPTYVKLGQIMSMRPDVLPQKNLTKPCVFFLQSVNIIQ